MRVLAAVCCLLLVGSLLAPVAAGASARPPLPGEAGTDHAGPSANASTNASAVAVTYAVDPLPDDPATVRVTASYAVRDLERFRPVLMDVHWLDLRVVETAGFSTRPGEGGDVRLAWDGRTESPSVTYELSRAAAYRPGEKYESRVGPFIDGGAWLLLRREQPVAYPDDVESRMHRELRVDTSRSTVTGTGVVLVGNHSTHERTVDGHAYHIVVPGSATENPSPARVFDALAAAERLVPGEPTGNGTYVFVTAGDRGVDEAIGHDLMVHESRSLTDAESIWVHEYVHTRQAYEQAHGPDPDQRLWWFDEGSAEYVASLVALYQGHVGFQRFHAAARGTDAPPDAMDGVLARPDTGTPATEYEKGARVLAALDARIRNATGGERTVLDVLARLNAREGVVTYPDFRDAVAAVAGERFDAWLDRYVTTDAVPPVPDDPATYANPDPAADSDGDGTPDRQEVAAGTDPFDPPRDGSPLLRLGASLGVAVVGAGLGLLALQRYR